MGVGDKIENAAEKAGGKGKEAAGAATGDESLRTEGPERPGQRRSEAGRREGQGRLQEGLTRPQRRTRPANGARPFACPEQKRIRNGHRPFPPCQADGLDPPADAHPTDKCVRGNRVSRYPGAFRPAAVPWTAGPAAKVYDETTCISPSRRRPQSPTGDSSAGGTPPGSWWRVPKTEARL